MSFENRPIIIKRRHHAAHSGSHGGAWKIAYADFVTAMMAFFLLMWLLSATTERQKKGLSDYFSPSVAVSKVSTGGDGLLYGEDVKESTSRSSSQQSGNVQIELPIDESLTTEIEQIVRDLDLTEAAGSGISSQIEVHPSDEGWVIELFDIEASPLFVAQSDRLQPRFLPLLEHLVKLLDAKTNRIAINGHLRSIPSAFEQIESWQLSSDRAAAVQRHLEYSGLKPDRIQRITGHADRKHIDLNPTSVRNNRIEIILLK